MTDTWQSLGEITARITRRLAPEPFSVALHPSLAAALKVEAAKSGHKPETLIAEAVRFYFGDVA